MVTVENILIALRKGYWQDAERGLQALQQQHEAERATLRAQLAQTWQERKHSMDYLLIIIGVAFLAGLAGAIIATWLQHR
jgi:outer membrane protein assembly factor BamD (BamD/ComL family)